MLLAYSVKYWTNLYALCGILQNVYRLLYQSYRSDPNVGEDEEQEQAA